MRPLTGPSLVTRLTRIPRWSVAPPGVEGRTLHNYRIVQCDAIAVGFTSAAAPFLGVYLARFGASNLDLGILASLPSIVGLVLSVPLGQFLLRRTRIQRWLGASRMLAHMTYGVIGLLPLVLPANAVVPAVLLLGLFTTIPQLIVGISFNVVMSTIAGPNGRFELLSRRWSIIVLTSALTVAAAGRILDVLPFPLNYQVVLVCLSLGSPATFYLLTRLRLPGREIPPRSGTALPIRSRASGFSRLIRSQPAFVSFIARLLPFTVGTRMALPLIPLFYVSTLTATDAEIGLIATVQAFAMLAGYLLWARQWRIRGGRPILLVCGATLACYPAGLAMSREIGLGLVLAVTAAASLSQAGLQLVLFDELMWRVPPAHVTTFVGVEQNVAHVAGLGGPLLGAAIAAAIGIPAALLLASGVSLVGYGLLVGDARRSVGPGATVTATSETS